MDSIVNVGPDDLLAFLDGNAMGANASAPFVAERGGGFLDTPVPMSLSSMSTPAYACSDTLYDSIEHPIPNSPPPHQRRPSVTSTQSRESTAEEIQSNLVNVLLAGRKPPSRKGVKQIDWNHPVNKERMNTALDKWLEKKSVIRQGIIQESDTEHKGLRAHCTAHNVPRMTFQARLLQADPYTVPTRGRPPLFSRRDCNAIADAVSALDHLNNGLDTSGLIDSIWRSHPEFQRSQISNCWHHTIKTSNSNLGRYKAQASARDRSGAITEITQRFYFLLVETARAMAEDLSPGVNSEGKTWRDLEAFFTLGLDEENKMANQGSEYTVGDGTKAKHENHNDEARMSITMVHTGSAAGDTGPAMYLMKGEKLPPEFENQFGSQKWLKGKGAPSGSFVVMTPNAFMTNDAWNGSAKQLAAGIRAMDVIRDHPEWWVVLHLDGFKSHVMTYEAQQTFHDAKILIVKENAHSSQVNQSFDQDVAKKSKAGSKQQ
jgi:hypothetical protein